mmetsp:Transcript_41358/g.125182  ORF Transcript_41358/g.125182 Transcript_41358/m.125182 type:complete len:250 (-) Transcript_41358:202-951(-)
MEEGERLCPRRHRPNDDDDDEEAAESRGIGKVLFLAFLVVFVAFVLSAVSPGACRGGLCVVPDSAVLEDAGGIISGGNDDDDGFAVAHEDPSFIGVGNVSRVFTCGLNHWLQPAVELLFPEYCPDRLYLYNMVKCKVDRVLRMAEKLGVPVEDSLLVVRPTIGGLGFIDESAFPGKVLYINVSAVLALRQMFRPILLSMFSAQCKFNSELLDIRVLCTLNRRRTPRSQFPKVTMASAPTTTPTTPCAST